MVYPYLESDLADLEQAIDELCTSTFVQGSTGRVTLAGAITRNARNILTKIDNILGNEDADIHRIIEGLCTHVSNAGSVRPQSQIAARACGARFAPQPIEELTALKEF